MPIAAGDSEGPVCHHALPKQVVLDLIQSHNVRHVVDLSPSPLNLSADLVSSACSYFALCATDAMRDYLQSGLLAKLKESLVKPGSELFDRRLAPRIIGLGADKVDGEEEDNEGEDGEPTPKRRKTGGRGRGRGRGRGVRKGTDGAAGADGEGAGEGAQPEGGDADGDLAKMLAEARARLNGANTGAEGASGGTGKE